MELEMQLSMTRKERDDLLKENETSKERNKLSHEKAEERMKEW